MFSSFLIYLWIASFGFTTGYTHKNPGSQRQRLEQKLANRARAPVEAANKRRELRKMCHFQVATLFVLNAAHRLFQRPYTTQAVQELVARFSDSQDLWTSWAFSWTTPRADMLWRISGCAESSSS